MNLVQKYLIFNLQVYRWLISPLKQTMFGNLGRCRFTPSCSAYALDAVRLHGAWRGSTLALKRLLRCHPWGGCGWDPVPPIEPRCKKAAKVSVGRRECALGAIASGERGCAAGIE